MKTLNVKRLEEICGKNLTIFQRQAINEWAKEYEKTVISEYRREFEQTFEENLATAINHYLIAIAFVLHFGETTKFGTKRLGSVLKDLQTTVELFSKKQYTAKEYLQMLKDDKIDIKLEL